VCLCVCVCVLGVGMCSGVYVSCVCCVGLMCMCVVCVVVCWFVFFVGRLIVAHEASFTGGFGGEIVSFVTSECFYSLEAPPVRYVDVLCCVVLCCVVLHFDTSCVVVCCVVL